jgi:hypothetical protein
MSSTLTHEEEQQIVEWLADHSTLTQGVGTEEAACSVAAWNLALTGTLTDKIPDCASEVIGGWIIGVQDNCPPEHGRGHPEWLRLLPLAAGTGREHEGERVAIVLGWMWGTVLPSLQTMADKNGFGEEWRVMCTVRTRAASYAAANAADAWYAVAAMYAAADAATYAADAATYAAVAADAATYAADAATYAAVAAMYAAYAAYAAKYAAYAADAAGPDVWATFAPIEVLRKLIAVTDARAVA